MMALLLALLKFAAFIGVLGVIALVAGSAFSTATDRWRTLTPLPHSTLDLDPSVDLALAAKDDLSRGRADTAQILQANAHAGDHCSSHSGGGYDGSSGGDGGAGGAD